MCKDTYTFTKFFWRILKKKSLRGTILIQPILSHKLIFAVGWESNIHKRTQKKENSFFFSFFFVSHIDNFSTYKLS